MSEKNRKENKKGQTYLCWPSTVRLAGPAHRASPCRLPRASRRGVWPARAHGGSATRAACFTPPRRLVASGGATRPPRPSRTLLDLSPPLPRSLSQLPSAVVAADRHHRSHCLSLASPTSLRALPHRRELLRRSAGPRTPRDRAPELFFFARPSDAGDEFAASDASPSPLNPQQIRGEIPDLSPCPRHRLRPLGPTPADGRPHRRR